MPEIPKNITERAPVRRLFSALKNAASTAGEIGLDILPGALTTLAGVSLVAEIPTVMLQLASTANGPSPMLTAFASFAGLAAVSSVGAVAAGVVKDNKVDAAWNAHKARWDSSKPVSPKA